MLFEFLSNNYYSLFSTTVEVWGLQVNLSAISHCNMKIIHKTNSESTQALQRPLLHFICPKLDKKGVSGSRGQ